MPPPKAVLGWILVSYFMIAGGFALAAAGLSLAGVESRGATDGVFFLGSLVGGLFAGRASRHKAVAEPTVAALLLVGTLIGIFTVGLGRRFSWAGAESTVAIALQLGLVAGLGGLVGGLVGRRWRPAAPTGSACRWWGIASLIHLGATFLVVSVALLASARAESGADDAVGTIFLALAVAWLLAGFVAQAIMPRRMVWVAGAGSIGIVLFGLAYAIAGNGFSPSTPLGAAFLWGIGTLIGALGALIGWKLVASRVAPPAATDVPEARVHS